MSTLVVGATGATGRLLVEQLLEHGDKVKVIVRTADSLSDYIKLHDNISIIQAALLDISDSELAQHVSGCDAIASCLGHNISLRGIFGPPYRLVTDATKRLCNAVKSNNPSVPVKYVLMNTTANRNRDLNEYVSFSHKFIIFLLRYLLPPQADNENAADYLRTRIGQNSNVIEWSAVRPDGLIDETEVTEYEIHTSPIRSAVFDAGKCSRINVGHFMARLIGDNATWDAWKGKMPVIYNKQ